MKCVSKIVLAGGSGYLGKIISRVYYNTSTEVVILTRRPSCTDKNIRYVQWNTSDVSSWYKELEQAEVVINLAGKSVNCRYTEKNKREIIASRVNATKAIGDAILRCSQPPKLWINAGSAAIFGSRKNCVLTEESSLGNGFSAEVCKQWEQAFNSVATPHTRKVLLRIGLVFGKGSWVLTPFITMTKFGLGGTMGKGDQFVSWIHEEDFLKLLDWVMEQQEVEGIINSVSPHPVSNKNFMKSLRKALAVPVGIPHPSFLIKVGGAVIGTDAELVLGGRRVVSTVLEEKNFDFSYPFLEDALYSILHHKN